MSARAAVLAAVLAAGALAAAGCSGSSGGGGTAGGDAIRITAKKFAFTPDKITLKRGKAATLELVSLDRKHGFKVPDLGIRTDVLPGVPARVTVTPEKTGTFPFRCDLFCGTGHDSMVGEIVVVE